MHRQRQPGRFERHGLARCAGDRRRPVPRRTGCGPHQRRQTRPARPHFADRIGWPEQLPRPLRPHHLQSALRQRHQHGQAARRIPGRARNGAGRRHRRHGLHSKPAARRAQPDVARRRTRARNRQRTPVLRSRLSPSGSRVAFHQRRRRPGVVADRRIPFGAIRADAPPHDHR